MRRGAFLGLCSKSCVVLAVITVEQQLLQQSWDKKQMLASKSVMQQAGDLLIKMMIFHLPLVTTWSLALGSYVRMILFWENGTDADDDYIGNGCQAMRLARIAEGSDDEGAESTTVNHSTTRDMMSNLR